MDDAFDALKAIMAPYAESLDVKHDEPGNFYLDTHHIMKNKKPLFFAAVQTKKNYVSYHLMPVYVNPELLSDMSPDLKKHMQGKSCFNFKTIDEPLFHELVQLTERSYRDYQASGYVDDS